MKRIFKLWLKEQKPKIKKMTASEVTTAFNKWVSSERIDGVRRFLFNACTNKHAIQKWIKS